VVFGFMGMQATSKGNMPVVLLKEGGTETKGREAQKNNIAAAKKVVQKPKDEKHKRTTLQQLKLLLKLFTPVLVHEEWIKC
jgi:hypothetical protein